MNPLIEGLNHFGENALQFAWLMLWQSSVLIAILFVADFTLRRRVRAAVRYALWLVLLVKLLLPPSLALPTSAAWWLFPSTASRKPPTARFVVSYGPDTVSRLPLQPAPLFTPPRPSLSATAWIIPVWGTLGFGLLVWMTARWRQVARDVKRAAPAPAWLDELFNAARSSIGLQRTTRLRLTDQAMSPAICGLFQPVILLPHSLVEKLPPVQLRAVLLHELTHLRRGDVWLNCTQALVQIVYWWHPLLWFANARIRRLREEAVDDAVMLALRDEAEAYAPTLLEVAKLAFHRPLASLGLVGILESRSALRQRIERLVNFQAPRKAGLTLVSLCGICIFSAVAVPMGEAPPPSTGATNVDQKESVADKAIEAAHLVQDAKVNYEMGKFDEADRLLTSALALAPENQAAHYYLNLVQAAKANRQWPSGIVRTSSGRKDIVDKLNRIRFDQVSWPDGLPLSEVLRNLSDQTKLRDPDKKGINFTFQTNAPAASAATASAGRATTINPTTGLPEATPADVAVDPSSINVKLTLTNVRLGDVLDAIVLVADHPIQYSILDDGIVFSTRGSNSAPLETRTFKVDANVITDSLRNVPGLKTNSVSTIARSLFGKLGVDWESPKGKSVFFNDRQGLLYVKATESDLDTIERALQALDYGAPQIHIKARFVEVPKSAAADLHLGSINPSAIHPDDIPLRVREIINRPSVVAGSNEPTALTGIMTASQFQTVRFALQSNPYTESLAEPEATTTSGRQLQMRATVILTMITNFALREISTNLAIVPQQSQVEVGPVLDTVAFILPDGCTIDLKVTSSAMEFLGYDNKTNTVPTVASTGAIIDVPTIHPNFRVQQSSAHLKLWDGQTVVLGKLPQYFYDSGKELSAETDYFRTAKRTKGQPGTEEKELLVFITVTLVDPAGNRIHSDDELAFARKSIPPQDSH